MTRAKLISLLLRVFWTAASAGVAAVAAAPVVDIGTAKVAAMVGLTAAANAVLVLLRQQLGHAA